MNLLKSNTLWYPSLRTSLMVGVCCGLLFLNIPLWAQLRSSDLTHYTERDGLPGAEVNCLLTDRFGYLWTGTINGLARFDGYGFKRFFSDPNDSGSIEGLVIGSLFEDRDGKIWVGTSPSTLNCYDPLTEKFKKYNFGDLVVNKSRVPAPLIIRAIEQDRDGSIFFGVDANFGGILSSTLLYLDENDKPRPVSSADNLGIRNIYKSITDSNGHLWFASIDGLIHKGENDVVQMVEFPWLDEEFITDMAIDRDGHVWMVTNMDRLIQFDPATHTPRVFTPIGVHQYDFGIHAIAFDQDDNIWFSTPDGLYHFDRNDNTIRTFEAATNKVFKSALIMDLEWDSFGNLWIGTASNGLFKYEERSRFISYTRETMKNWPEGWASSLHEARNGNLLIFTSGPRGTTLVYFDSVNQSTRVIPLTEPPLQVYNVGGVLEHSPGKFYFSSESGLFEFIESENLVRKVNDPPFPGDMVVYSFYHDSRKNFWLCTSDGLYRRAPGSSSFSKYDLSSVKGGNSLAMAVMDAIESQKHGLWLMTNSGLFRYDYSTDQIERKGFEKSKGDILPSQDINSLYEDERGTLWVGTWQGGLNRYDVESGTIKTYTMNDGLPSMSIQGILADENKQRLWLSTFDGIASFDMATEEIISSSVADGIQGSLFTDGAALKTRSGVFIFGGANGITLFDPATVSRKVQPPKVLLTDFKLFDKSVVAGKDAIFKAPLNETSEVTLDYDQNNITLDFIALHYSDPAKNRIAYTLENFDEGWREAHNIHSAFYPRLDPGNYRFRVKAANSNGVWNDEGATIGIRIRPPWWRTAWAYVVYTLLAIGVAFGTDRILRRRIVQKEREKTRARELAQAKEIEKAYSELKATQSQLIQSEKMASLGELTAGIAHEIQNPLNFVNNFSEINVELVDELTREIDDGNVEEVKALANDIRENELKIMHHGKRADAIVKGMLHHSRNSAGEKETTDINLLADEYLRLAYHGLRAKDKSFNAGIKTEFDDSVGNLLVVPQDIGRVILNLITNAFYAVTEKKKSTHAGYEPLVTVKTKRSGSKVTISITDNGEGIPENILDKIFHPFFTTKPAGQGTGLGLSMSYDIVTKAHNGKLEVETKENEGTTFIITLPA